MVQAVVRSRPGFRHDRLRGHLIEYALEPNVVPWSGRWTDPETRQRSETLTAWALLLIEQDPDKGVVFHRRWAGSGGTWPLPRGRAPAGARVRVSEELFGAFDPEVAAPLEELGLLFYQTNRLDEAEPLFRRALAITKKSAVGPDHPAAVSTTWRGCRRPPTNWTRPRRYFFFFFFFFFF